MTTPRTKINNSGQRIAISEITKKSLKMQPTFCLDFPLRFAYVTESQSNVRSVEGTDGATLGQEIGRHITPLKSNNLYTIWFLYRLNK